MSQNFNCSFDEYIEAKSLRIQEILGDGHGLINAVAFNLKSLNYDQIIESSDVNTILKAVDNKQLIK